MKKSETSPTMPPPEAALGCNHAFSEPCHARAPVRPGGTSYISGIKPILAQSQTVPTAIIVTSFYLDQNAPPTSFLLAV